MQTRKLRRRVMSRLQWFDRLEALGMDYEEALFLFHDKLAPLDESAREREFRRIAQERVNAVTNATRTC